MNDTQDTIGSSDSFNPSSHSDTFYFHSNDGELLAYDAQTQKQKLYKNIHEDDLSPDGVCITPNKEMALSVNSEGQIYQHNLKTDKRFSSLPQAAYRGLYLCKFTPNGKNFFATNVYGELYEWLYEKDQNKLS
jgi:WD40 repeat protein